MMTPTSTFVFGLVYVNLASTLAVVFSSDMKGEESKIVSDVLKDLPHANCDMIVVSSSPLHGKMPPVTLAVTQQQRYLAR